MLTDTYMPDDYIPDEDAEFYASVEVASGSNGDPDGTVTIGQDFQLVLLIAIGVIIGILLIGSRRFH